MRREIYRAVIAQLSRITKDGVGYRYVPTDEELPEGAVSAIRHIDLWNHNVEFIEQEESWGRPAVFIEFSPIVWENRTKSIGDYTGTFTLHLHVVTDWSGSSSSESSFLEESLSVFSLLEAIDESVCNLLAPAVKRLRLTGSVTNHNHAELNESVERYVTRVVDTATMRSRLQPTTSPTLDIDASYK